jgi:general transcription factor 3C polypeptide 3 (transcription factor C subunit 4)
VGLTAHHLTETDSSKKDKLLMAIEDGKLKIFRGIRIDDWLTLTIRYAFTLTRRDLYGIASEVLKHIRLSVVYQERHYQDTIRLCIIGKHFTPSRHWL